jgi:hypothetical protein
MVRIELSARPIDALDVHRLAAIDARGLNTRPYPIANQLHGCMALDLIVNGSAVGLVAAGRVDDHGFIVGAVGEARGVRLVHALPDVEAMLGDVKTITIETKRPGLMRELRKQGYRIEGAIWTKRVGQHGRA